MADLPKIVRERLAAAPAGAHPDADLLTGFAEKRLGERERAQVLAHLAACAACREVVSLALPEEEETAAVAAPQAGRGWVLRWQTAVALATVAVAAVALLTIPNSFFRSRSASPTQVAQAPASAGKNAATREESKAPATQPAEPEARAADGSLASGKKRAEGQGGGAGGGLISSELAKAEQGREEKDKLQVARSIPSPPQKKEDQVHALAPPPPSSQPGAAPATSQYDFKTAQAAPVAADQAATQTSQQQKQAVGGVLGTPGVYQRAPAEARKAPAQQAQVTEQAPARPSNETVEVSAEAVPVSVPQWRTTASGRLQRSRDAGQSWRTVHVAAGTVLNAVSAVGEHVWAGGHQQRTAVLYYSADNGAHWARLDFTAPAGAQAADVVALNFTDAQHGVMTVVAADDPRLRQIWMTADGGHTWSAPPTR